MLPVFIALLILAVILLFWGIGIYNRLIGLKNTVDSAWSDMDVQLKRRYDLIPNLLETVKGYAKHEEGVFTKVTEARTQAMRAKTPAQIGTAEAALAGAMTSLFAVVENYPDLKASQNFQDLQNDLEDTENQIQSSRSVYNKQVRVFNTATQQFPNNVIAGLFGFKSREFFEIENKKEKEAPKIKF